MKLQTPKGTRDFLPEQAAKRNYIFDTAKAIFRLYGYLPIETPAMENVETLMGKYGEEGDRLIFKVLPRGEKLTNAIQNQHIEKSVEEALKYDLTVPFARFVVQHQNELHFPFKRYQIQPVWRADRPQKGRYREFYQCDVDVVGSDSLLNEVELIDIINDVFQKLGVEVLIKLNNRKILSGIAETIGAHDKIIDLTVALDKLDKIGKEGVIKELKEKGFDDESITKLQPVIDFSGNNEQKLEKIASIIGHTAIGQKGLDEIQTILAYSKAKNIVIDITLARGLNYYTGAIFEVQTKDFPSSICGGGRYDDLTGIFGLPNVSGVGVSFGADRIYDVMQEANIFPDTLNQSLEVLFLNFGENESKNCLELATSLRQIGISCEVYPDTAKIKKQLKYADTKKVRWVALLGETELANHTIVLKNMLDGTQQEIPMTQLIPFFNKK
jgi:histidyl-tRNA synthetase